MDDIKGYFTKTTNEYLVTVTRTTISGDGGTTIDTTKQVFDSVVNEVFIKKQAPTIRMLPSIKNMRVLGEKPLGSHRPHTNVQDFETIRNQCLASGNLFEDPLFPASNESLMFSKRPDRYIEWLRPHEITDHPQFFVEGYSRFDVQQGELGDCWLLAATADLTHDSSLFFRVVPPDQSFEENYAGIFHFRFWQYGKWIDVVVDDRLPTYRGKLIYMHSTEVKEFWSSLLEKAYAKLHGSYEALKGGLTCDGLQDFTGGFTEEYNLKEAPSNLFSILAKGLEHNSMMGCSLGAHLHPVLSETREGLLRGHAYSITKLCTIDIVAPMRRGKVPMIRLRNPWGDDVEWKGPWSDNSAEWRFISDKQKQELSLNFDRDGEFWMSFQDFLHHFDRVEICHLSPDSLTETQQKDYKRKWEMSLFEGEWTAGVTAGGCRNYLETFWHNPQYIITLEHPDEKENDGKCTVIVALMQKNRRSKRNLRMECLSIGLAIYHLTERDMRTRPQGITFFAYRSSACKAPNFTNKREVTARFRLPPGHYLIVPSTFEPNEEAEFMLRVFSERQHKMQENDDQVGYDEKEKKDDNTKLLPVKPANPQERDALQGFFDSVAGTDWEIDWKELKRVLDYTLKDSLVDNPEGFTKDVCRSMVAMLDTDKSGTLSFEELEALLTDIAKWKAVFKVYDVFKTGRIDGFQLRTALHSAGYQLNNRILNVLGHRYGSKDGKIAFDDFLMCAVKIKTYMDIFKDKDIDNTETATFTMDEWIESTIYS